MAEIPRSANSQAFERTCIPRIEVADFRSLIVSTVKHGARLSALFGYPEGDRVVLCAVLAHSNTGDFSIFETEVGEQYPAITPECPQAHKFECEIAEQWGIVPEGHPALKPVRFHRSYRAGHDAWGRADTEEILPCVTNFYRIEGDAIHEVAVGPVHAGIIEPGHFRFQCDGEEVLHLEISLGYQHRDAERLLSNAPASLRVHLAEALAGDTSIGHSVAHCQALEALSNTNVPPRAELIRGIALELERLANHTGDMGALAGDIGYLPTLSYCGRLRGDFLNMSALLCGSRFGRGLTRFGGVNFDIDADRAKELRKRLDATMRDTANAIGLLWTTPSVLARFEETGTISKKTATDLGLVGVAARACGLERDARFEFPAGAFLTSQVPVAMWHTGDVFARAWVRWMEIEYSAAFIREQLETLPSGEIAAEPKPLMPNSAVVAVVEGWRGEVVHVVFTDAEGKIERVKVVDPSFHNWQGLAHALRGQQISDFPLCNKSFNLSYCGHDL